jgi:sec-independent protein translocase protein TatA
MGSFSWAHWLVVGVIAMLLFGGRGKISELMGDFAKGIKAFKKGMSDEEAPAAAAAATDASGKIIEHKAAEPAATVQAEAQRKAG